MIKKYEVYLTYESGTSGGEICDGQQDSDWPDREDTCTMFVPKNIKLKAPEWSETIEIDFDPSKLEYLYVVIVRYSSGDTFGSTLGNWHIAGAYANFAKAKKIENKINNDTYKGYTPWVGYFEALEGVTVEKLDIWK
ncbi:MAG: hypothetical protein ACTSUK_01760 [Promethearchaeota archaeon]